MRYLLAIADPEVCRAQNRGDFTCFFNELVSTLVREQVRFKEFGVQVILQVRLKSQTDKHRYAGYCYQQSKPARDCGVMVVLNGLSSEAVHYGYSGVHWPEACIPQMPPEEAFVFCSAAIHGVEGVRRATKAATHVFVFAPVFSPRSKTKTPGGIEALAEVVQSTTRPVIALGGITPDRVQACVRVGAAGVGSLGGLVVASDMGRELRELAKALDSYRKWPLVSMHIP